MLPLSTSNVANAKVELVAKIDRLEIKIDAQFYRLVAFFLPLMFGVADWS